MSSQTRKMLSILAVLEKSNRWMSIRVHLITVCGYLSFAVLDKSLNEDKEQALTDLLHLLIHSSKNECKQYLMMIWKMHSVLGTEVCNNAFT